MSIENKMRNLEHYIRNKIIDATNKQEAYTQTANYDFANKFNGIKIAYYDIYERLFGSIKNISS